MTSSCKMEEVEVTVKNACKQFTSQIALRDLTMTVNTNSVYGLLGPSGCGKTTLLRCMLGIELLDSGSISLSNDKPENIGYMPQETALYGELKIMEIFQFYAQLYAVDRNTLKDRIFRYCSIFDLPDLERFLSTLSGGEVRRVSLVVSLIHSPNLIVLDEPTVGLDPVVQHRVWQHLIHLSKDGGKTILITTHYIEEARKCDKVGLMRNGTLLVEDRPETLIKRMECATLEQVFLKMCCLQNEDLQQSELSSNKKKISISSLVECPVNYEQCFKMRRFIAKLLISYFKARRTIWVLVFVLLIPLLLAYIFSLMNSNSIVASRVGTYFEEISHKNVCLSPVKMKGNFSDHVFSCYYREKLREILNIIEYENFERGVTDMENNKIIAMIHIGPNFTDAFVKRISDGYLSTDADEEASTIDVYTMRLLYAYHEEILSNILPKYFEDCMDIIMENRNLPKKLGRVPIQRNFIFYTDPIRFRGYNLSGFIAGLCFYMAFLFTSTAMFDEVSSGISVRTKVAGLTYLEGLSAHLVLQSFVLLIQIFCLLFIPYYVFNLEFYGGPLSSGLYLFSTSMVGVVTGCLWAQLIKSYMLLAYLCVGIAVGMLLVMGTIWPEEAMWYPLKVATQYAPIISSTQGFRAIITRGESFLRPVVYLGLLSNLAWIILLAILTYLVSHKTHKTHKLL